MSIISLAHNLSIMDQSSLGQLTSYRICVKYLRTLSISNFVTFNLLKGITLQK